MNARNLASDLCRVMKEISSLLNPSPLFLKGLRRHVLHAAGKQQRSRLLLILGHLCGVSRRPLITAAAAVEAVHLATLIHDDILDGATRRRSKDTLHLSHGISSALLYGDLVFTRGVSAVNSLGNKQLTDLLLSTVRALCMGEILEAREAGRFPWNERIYRRIAGLKTAALFQFACEAPGILAGYGRGRLAMLSRFGMSLGFSYQIADDCSDCAPLSRNPGKDRLLDLKNRVPTFPLILAARGREGRLLVRRNLSAGGGRASMERLGAILRARGFVREAAARAMIYLARAKTDADTIQRWGSTDTATLLHEYLNAQFVSLRRFTEW